jgi:hypothetical protein
MRAPGQNPGPLLNWRFRCGLAVVIVRDATAGRQGPPLAG